MKKRIAGLFALVAMAVQSVRADLSSMVTAMQTEATSGISTVETAVIAVLTAAFVFVMIFFAYRLIRRSVK